ncbi:TRL domain-containing protein [Pseudomonadota bacterium]
MKKIILLFLPIFVVACASSRVTPYENMSITANNLTFEDIQNVKVGESCAELMGSGLLNGTASIIEAQKKADIKTIKMVDYRTETGFFDPAKFCIIVYGE